MAMPERNETMTSAIDEEVVEDLAARLEGETGKVPIIPARFFAFTDLEMNVREQIRKVRSHPWIPESLRVRGFIHDVDTARLVEVSL